MNRRIRVVIGVFAVAACALGIAGLVAPAAVGAGGGGQFCGGIAGIPCPDGFVCVDVPGDGCNPKSGGADCAGVCRRGH